MVRQLIQAFLNTGAPTSTTPHICHEQVSATKNSVICINFKLKANYFFNLTWKIFVRKLYTLVKYMPILFWVWNLTNIQSGLPSPSWQSSWRCNFLAAYSEGSPILFKSAFLRLHSMARLSSDNLSWAYLIILWPTRLQACADSSGGVIGNMKSLSDRCLENSSLVKWESCVKHYTSIPSTRCYRAKIQWECVVIAAGCDIWAISSQQNHLGTFRLRSAFCRLGLV